MYGILCTDMLIKNTAYRIQYFTCTVFKISVDVLLNIVHCIFIQLKIYAKYYHSLDHMILPDGFVARVVSYEEQEKRFDTNRGTVITFTFILTFPIIALVFVAIIVGGLHSNISTILKKADHLPAQAALVCVGQSYTLYVAIMDVKAVTKDEMSQILFSILSFFVTVEFGLFFVINALIFILCSQYCTEKLFSPYKEEVQRWFVLVGLIPALVCLSSHIGFVIEGWISSNSRGSAVMLLYSCLFVALFIVFQNLYSCLLSLYSCLTDGQQNEQTSVEPNNPTVQETTPLLQADNQQEEYLNFRTLAVELFIGIPFLVGVLVYIGYGVFHVPIIRGTEDVVDHVYQLGTTAAIFVVFLFTYFIYLYNKKK